MTSKPLPDLSDLDPYAPTLGSTLRSNSSSKLELLSNDSPPSSPTEASPPDINQLSLSTTSSPPLPPKLASTSTFLGTMFRSNSTTSSASSSASTSAHAPPTQSLKSDDLSNEMRNEKPIEYDEKSGNRKLVASLPTTPFRNAVSPLASIASVFRSATSSSVSSPTSISNPSSPSKGKGRLNLEEDEEEDEKHREVVFDFNKFLEQMRSRPADSIAKYLRS